MILPEKKVKQLVGHLFRHEAGKMAAVLTRLLGASHIDVAEDIVQDTLLKAMETWSFHGMPDQPQAWLYTVAKNKALDFIRSQKRHSLIHAELATLQNSGWALSASMNQLFLENEIQDSQLRMIFACCHPAISEESQIAMTLKILCGLSTSEIASAFLTSDETIQKRIARAKEKLRDQKIKLEVPSPEALPARLGTVLKTLYLLFNEGYYSSNNKTALREDLCEEAMRLTYLLIQHPQIKLPKVNALMALMCLQASRFPARTTSDGSTVLLEKQDRTLWNRELIQQGLTFLETAAAGNELSEYHIEASIASIHAKAFSFRETNWNQLLYLYKVLFEIKPEPIVAMNKAIALGYAHDPTDAIEELLNIKGLDDNHFYHTALGNFYQLARQKENALQSYSTALKLTRSSKDTELLQQKITDSERFP